MALSLASWVLSAAFSASSLPICSRRRPFSLTSSSVSSAPRLKNVCRKASRFSLSSAATTCSGRSLRREPRPFFSVIPSSNITGDRLPGHREQLACARAHSRRSRDLARARLMRARHRHASGASALPACARLQRWSARAPRAAAPTTRGAVTTRGARRRAARSRLPVRSMAARSSASTASSCAIAAARPPDDISARRTGRAMPAAVAPSAMARATSRPRGRPRRWPRWSRSPWARAGRPQAPVGTPQSQNASPRACAAASPAAAARRVSTPTHEVPPGARDVDVLDAHLAQAPPDGRGDAAPGLLDHDGHAQVAHEARDRLEPVTEVAVAARLHQLHRRVQVNAERVGAHLVDQDAHLAGRHRARLHHADVAEDQRASARRRARGRCPPVPGRTMHRALAAEAEAVAALLGDARELAVDAARLVGAARHRRDDERRAQLLAEERDREVDVRQRHVRQRVVDQAHALEQRRGAAEADVLLGAEGQVVRLALADRRHRRGP